MNMSYCRFHNTIIDLEDCIEHIEDTNLSEEEHKNRVKLIELCFQVWSNFIDNEDEPDFGIVNNPD